MTKLDDKIESIHDDNWNYEIEIKNEFYWFAEWLVNELKMEGLSHKLTPFQETVNTYLKNKAEEIGVKFNSPTKQS